MSQQPTLPKIFQQTAQRLGDKTALRQKKFGLWEAISWTDYYQQARYAAQAFIELGLKAGEFVAILGDNAAEWVILDMGIQMAGGVSVGIYSTSSWKQVQYILNHADCKYLIAENEEQVDKWLQLRDQCPQLEKVIYWEKKGLQSLNEPQLMDFESFMEQGKQKEAADPARLNTRMEQIQSEDLAILVYTSGTTGPPKGAMLTHGNLSWMSQSVPAIEPGMTVKDHDEVLSFLPLCHIFERLFSVIVQIAQGYTVNFVESPDTVPQNLREVSPTLGYAVPRIWEKYYSNIFIQMDEANWFKRWIYQQALKIGQAYADHRLNGNPVKGALAFGNWLVQISVFYHLKKRLGFERMRFAFSGAAPISPDVLRFFHAIGLKLIEGYGQTEGSGVTTASPVDKFRLGTVGKAIPGGEVRIAEDGEILFRSPGVFKGYYKNPEATAQTIRDGWLHSGDIGSMDEEGYIRIIDRKKDLIITAGGKNIAPQYIENKLKFSPYINDSILIGDRRKFLSALIVLDEENVVKYAQDHKIPFSTYSDLATDPHIFELIDKEVQMVNKQLARVENVRKFTILPKKLYEEDGEITPTMKVKRSFINKTYADLIERMYR
ncbi:MAG: AMP-binding protein [Bacteroidota bacterium]